MAWTGRMVFVDQFQRRSRGPVGLAEWLPLTRSNAAFGFVSFVASRNPLLHHVGDQLAVFSFEVEIRLVAECEDRLEVVAAKGHIRSHHQFRGVVDVKVHAAKSEPSR